MSNNDKQHALVPRLRFPDFAGQAVRKLQLEDVTTESTIRNEETLTASSVMGVTKAEGIVPMEERLIASDITRYKLVQKNWFAYNPMRLNIGSIARWKGMSDILVSPDYVVFKCLENVEPGIDPAYLDHFRQTDAWKNFVTEGGDGSVRVRIYYKDIARVQLALPSRAEQRKIAECLGSLDDLIAAEGRKLAALQEHKKGLMQQLFPREGETRPRLRFSEFSGARTWTNEKLDDLAKRGTGHTPNKAKPEYYNGGIKWVSLADSKRLDQGLISVTSIEISDEGIRNSSAVLHPLGTVILSRDAGVGKSAVLGDQMAVSQHFVVWQCNARRLSNWFLYYHLQRSKSLFEEIATGSTVKTIGIPFFKAMRVTLPEVKEQHRIADCLSALDARIAGQAANLDALRNHKRGLMQQLFPSPEGAAI